MGRRVCSKFIQHLQGRKAYTSTEGLTEIAETTDSFFVDELESSGTFYYSIIANGAAGSSELSNTAFVQVEINDIGGENGGVSTITITEDSTDEGFLDSPLSVPFIISSIAIVVLIKRRNEI